jgi:maltose/maltodextrin transport system substrate-binding protein
MAQGKSAMMISRPWDWPGLIKSGIDLGVTLVHGINGKLGRAFMGVQVALSQSQLAESRPDKRIRGEKGLSASDQVTPIGIPAMISQASHRF